MPVEYPKFWIFLRNVKNSITIGFGYVPVTNCNISININWLDTF